MTDTTDTKALREAYKGVEKQAHSMRGRPREYQVITGFCPVNVIEMQAQRIIELFDQLEAERQRADANEGGKNAFNSITKYIEDKQRNETHTLWREVSDQLNADGCNSYSSHVIEYLEALNGEIENQTAELAAMKAKLANPVVLQDFHAASIQSTQPFNLFDVIVATQVSDAKAIRAAGFTVKGE